MSPPLVCSMDKACKSVIDRSYWFLALPYKQSIEKPSIIRSITIIFLE